MNTRIDIYSHYFTITPNNPVLQQAVKSFSKRFLFISPIYNKQGQKISEQVKMFAAANADRSVIRYHRNVYDDFIGYLKERYIKLDSIDVIEHPIPESTPVNFIVNNNYSPRESQIPVIDFITNKETPRFKLLALDTGEGKTISTFFAMSVLKKRTVVIMRPGYIERWIDEINKVLINPKVIMVIGADLKKFIHKVKNNDLEYDIALVSNKTFYFFLKSYEKFGKDLVNEEYGCTPDNFFETIKADFRVIDEVHQDFHFNFRLDLYSNVQTSLSLSATLVNSNTTLDRMYSIAYPKEFRYYTKNPIKFRKMICVFYSINEKFSLRDSNRGINAYSHLVYEKSIIKFRSVLKDYLNMVYELVNDYFLIKRGKEDKLIIFAATVRMCSEIVDYLSKKCKDISVAKYTGDDEYVNLIDPVIRVTTPGSGGTAHDIPNLTTIITLIAIDSTQTNLQMFGRLRYIKDKEINYICLINQDHPKHMGYHRKREKLLSSKCSSIRHTVYQSVLGA